MTNLNPIICPLRNSLPLTKAAHKTFEAQDIPVEIFYINNGSTDGTVEWLNSKDVYVVHHSSPLSVSASWNQGLSFWFDAGAEACMVVNNDVLLRPDTYRRLLEAKESFATAIGNDDPDSILSLSPPIAPSRPHPDFSCFLIRRDVWDKVGPFNEEYRGAYAEDAEYHVRMHEAGIQAVSIDLPFYHLGAGTLKTTDDEGEIERVRDCANANRKLFKERHGVEVGTDEYYALFGSSKPSEEPLDGSPKHTNDA